MAATAKASSRQVAAVMTICTYRKKIRPAPAGTAVSLQISAQARVQTAWRKVAQGLVPAAPAAALYAGRGFGLALQAAADAHAKFYVLSAGLGLIAGDQRIPTYGLTVSGGSQEDVSTKVDGKFDPAAWFDFLLAGPFSRQWPEVAGRSGRVLIAMTRPYAALVGASLAALDTAIVQRLRIFGASLTSVLPPTLRPMVVPYDARLDSLFPGTKADFAQRALLHFVGLIAANPGPQGRDADFAAVEAALNELKAPDRVHRPRRTDEEIVQLIAARLASQTGIARLLRALRDEEGVACEQSRFSRLYRTAVDQEARA